MYSELVSQLLDGLVSVQIIFRVFRVQFGCGTAALNDFLKTNSLKIPELMEVE